MNNCKLIILNKPKKFYYPNQETPMDSTGICYSSGNFVGSILRTGCLAGGRCGFHLISKIFARWNWINWNIKLLFPRSCAPFETFFIYWKWIRKLFSVQNELLFIVFNIANSIDISFYTAMGILLSLTKSSYKLLFTILLGKGGLNLDGGNQIFIGVVSIWCVCRVTYSVVIWYARRVTYTVGIPYVRRVTYAVGTWYARRVIYSVGIWYARCIIYTVGIPYVRPVTYAVGTSYARRVTYYVGIWYSRHVTYSVDIWYARRVTYSVDI